ncbi:unnamed protein product [Heterobilharzia americana]|nr:unnamed protein product [Heterobilharzia americana]
MHPQSTWSGYENHAPPHTVWPSQENSVSSQSRWGVPENQSVNQVSQGYQHNAVVPNCSFQHYEPGNRQYTNHPSNEISDIPTMHSIPPYGEPYSNPGNAYNHDMRYQRRWNQNDQKSYDCDGHNSEAYDYHHSHTVERHFDPSVARPYYPYSEVYPRSNQSGRNMWPRNPEPRQTTERFHSPAELSGMPYQRPGHYNQARMDEPRYAPCREHMPSEVESNHFRGYHDQDYRMTQNSPLPSNNLDENWKDVDIRPVPFGDGNHPNPTTFPSILGNKSKDNRPISLIPTPTELPCKPRGRIAQPPVPEHLIPAFEEAAVSTGAWPLKGLELEQTGAGGVKPRALPAWLRDELEKLEKKKAKELAAVAGATVLGAAPDAKRDDEGDIVMEDEAKSDVHTLNFSLLNNNEESDGGDYEKEESPLVTESEGNTSPKTAVKQLATANSESILSNTTASLTPVHPLTQQEFRELFALLSEEEQRTETARFITRTLTEALLAVTTELIDDIVDEVMTSEAISNKPEATASKDDGSIVEIKSPLLGLVSYNSESESDSEPRMDYRIRSDNLSGILPVDDEADDVKRGSASQNYLNDENNENDQIAPSNVKREVTQEKHDRKHSHSPSSRHKSSKRYKSDKEKQINVKTSRIQTKHSSRRKTTSRHSYHSRRSDSRDSITSTESRSNSNHSSQRMGSHRSSRQSTSRSGDVGHQDYRQVISSSDMKMHALQTIRKLI